MPLAERGLARRTRSPWHPKHGKRRQARARWGSRLRCTGISALRQCAAVRLRRCSLRTDRDDVTPLQWRNVTSIKRKHLPPKTSIHEHLRAARQNYGAGWQQREEGARERRGQAGNGAWAGGLASAGQRGRPERGTAARSAVWLARRRASTAPQAGRRVRGGQRVEQAAGGRRQAAGGMQQQYY